MAKTTVIASNAQVAATAQLFCNVSTRPIRIRPNQSAMCDFEATCKIETASSAGKTIGAENFVRKSPDKLDAAIANLTGEIFWNNCQQLQIVAVKKNAAGTSDVTSALCARKFGSNAIKVSATKAPAIPKNSRVIR